MTIFVFVKDSNFTKKIIKTPIKLTEIKSSFSEVHVKLHMPLLKNCLNNLRTKKGEYIYLYKFKQMMKEINFNKNIVLGYCC